MMSGSPAVAAVYDRGQYSNLRDRRRSFLEAARYRACASRTDATVAILDFLCKAPGIRERLLRRVLSHFLPRQDLESALIGAGRKQTDKFLRSLPHIACHSPNTS